jgi:hypothetical protein
LETKTPPNKYRFANEKYNDAPNVNSNPLPNHASSSEGVNVVEIGGKKERVLKVLMESMYGMLV